MSDFNLLDGKWEGVEIDEIEVQDLIKFLIEHSKCGRSIRIWRSSASGIGQNLAVDCTKHQKNSQTDITNYGSW
jgi:hypothetical protein